MEAGSPIDQERLQALDAALQKAHSRINEARRIGAPIDGATQLYDSATGAIENNDIERAFENAHAAIIAAEKQLETRVSEAVERAMQRVANQETMFEIPNAKTQLEKAQRAIENSEYQQALQLAQDALETVDTIQASYDRAVTLLRSTWGRLSDAKEKDMDVDAAEALLQHARRAFKQQDFSATVDACEQAAELIAIPSEIEYENATRRLDNYRERIDRMEETGCDTALLKKRLKEVETAINLHRFEAAAELFSQLDDECRVAREKKHREETLEALETVDNAIRDAEDAGLDTGRATTLFEEAKRCFDAGEILKAKNVALRAQQVLESLRHYQGRGVARERLEAFCSYIADAEEFGADMSHFHDVLAIAEGLEESGDYDELVELVEDEMEKVKELRHTYFLQSSPIIFSSAKRSIAKIKRLGLGCEKAESKMAEAKLLLDEGRYEKAIAAAKEISATIQRIEQKHYGETASEALLRLQKTHKELSSAGINTHELELLIEQALAKFEAKEYIKTLDLAKRAERAAEKYRDTFYAAHIDARFEAVEGLFETLEAEAFDTELAAEIEPLRTTLEEARVFAENGSYGAAYRTLDEIEVGLQQARLKRLGARYDRIVEDAGTVTERLGLIPPDLSELADILERATDELESGTLSEARDIIARAWSMLETLQRQRDALDLLVGLKSAMEELIGAGVEAEVLRERYQRAEDAVLEVEFDVADAAIAELERELEQARTRAETIEKEAERAISDAQELLSENDPKIDVENAQDELKRAIVAFGTDRFEIALQHATRSMELYQFAHKFNAMVETLQETRDRLRRAKNAGLDISAARQTFLLAKPALEQHDLDRVEEIVVRTEQELERVKSSTAKREKRATDEILEVKDRLEAARKTGADLARAEELLDDAKRAYKRKNYDGTLSMLAECKEEIDTCEHIRMVIGELKHTRRELDELEAMGVDTDDAEDIFSEAKPALIAGEYDRALHLAHQALGYAKSMMEKTEMESTITAVLDRVARLKKRGVVLGDAASILEDLESIPAREVVERHRFAERLDEALNAREGAYEAAAQSIRDLQEKLSQEQKRGVDVKNARSAFARLAENLDDGNYDAILARTGEIVRLLAEASEAYDRVADAVQRAQSEIGAARKLGADVSIAQQYFGITARALRAGNNEEAYNAAQRAYESASKARERYEEIVATVSAVQKQLAAARSSGYDVSKIMFVMKQMLDAFDRAQYDHGFDLAQDCLRELDRLMSRHEQLNALSERCERALARARKAGRDIARAQVLFERSTLAKKRGDFTRAESFLEQCFELVGTEQDRDE